MVGELILTTLTTRAFPLIRFKTGDRARFLKSPCICGSPFIRIEWFDERTDDMLNIRGVKVNQGLILLQLKHVLGFAPTNCHFIKKRHGAKNYLEVWLSVDDRLFSDQSHY